MKCSMHWPSGRTDVNTRRTGLREPPVQGDPAIEALADKIAVVQDARLEGRSHPFGARVSIDAGGETLERLVPDPSGEPSLFPDAPAMRQKFLQLARPVLDGGAERFADAILALDSVARVDAVTALARP